MVQKLSIMVQMDGTIVNVFVVITMRYMILTIFIEVDVPSKDIEVFEWK